MLEKRLCKTDNENIIFNILPRAKMGTFYCILQWRQNMCRVIFHV